MNSTSLNAYIRASMIDDINIINVQLRALDTEYYRGALVRSRSQRFLEEQPSRRSLGGERRFALSEQALQVEYNGCTTDDPELMMMVFADHFRCLFQDQKTMGSEASTEGFISLLPQLSQDDCGCIDSDIDIQEQVASLNSLAKGKKTLDPDGLTGEFYQQFCP